MRLTRMTAGFVGLVMFIAPSAGVLAYRGDWNPPDRGARDYPPPAARRPVPPPQDYNRPAAPVYRPPDAAAGGAYRPLPAYPPNWRAPGPLPPGYRPAYPPPPGYRPYPPPPGYPGGLYPPRYYPGYRPPVLAVAYPGYTTGQVIAGALVVGMVIAAISESAQPTVVNNVTYYYDGENYYEPVTDGLETEYKVVDNPYG